jgi:hypothetical protein
MKRLPITVALMLLLALPLMAGADDQGWMPPEWTPTPPAQQTIETAQLASLLVDKGMITPQDYAQLTQPPGSSPAPQGNGRGWTWDEIEAYQRSPIRSSGN